MTFNYFASQIHSLKRFAVISLVPLLLFNTIGYYLVFYGDIIAAKHEAEVFIYGHDSHSEKIVTLTFALRDGKPVAQDLTFTDDDEFVYQGRMYDVISSRSTHGQIVYQCYTDIRETAINQNLCHKVNAENDTPSQNHKNGSVLKEFAKDYTLHEAQIIRFVPAIRSSYTHRTSMKRQPSIYRPIVSPPPESFIS